MKFLAFFAVFLLFVNLSQQIPKLINCTADHPMVESVMNHCGVFTCEGPDRMSGKGCGTWQCAPGTQIGYVESDGSKPYPECCGGPICGNKTIHTAHLTLDDAVNVTD